MPPSPGFCLLLSAWVGAQAALLLAQRAAGPRCFVPKALLPPRYDYHRPAVPRQRRGGGGAGAGWGGRVGGAGGGLGGRLRAVLRGSWRGGGGGGAAAAAAAVAGGRPPDIETGELHPVDW